MSTGWTYYNVSTGNVVSSYTLSPYTGIVLYRINNLDLSTLSSNLIAYWKLDETSGTLQDSVGTLHLTNDNALLGQTGKILNAPYFNNNTDSLYYDNWDSSGGSYFVTDEFSVSLWAKVDGSTDSAGYQYFINHDTEEPWNYGFCIYATYITCYPNFVVKTIDDDYANCSKSIPGTTYMVPGTWYHIVGVCYGSGEKIRTYVDGVYNESTMVLPDKPYFGPGQLCIGNESSAKTLYARGYVDEVGIWNKALTPDEVSTLYNNGLGLSYPFVESSSDVSVPTVTTSAITDISAFTATGGGNVTHDGSIALTYRGICWGISENPTVADTSTRDSSTGEGTYVSYLTDLNSSTHYYVRAFAYNSVGISYGIDVSFNTTYVESPPFNTEDKLVRAFNKWVRFRGKIVRI